MIERAITFGPDACLVGVLADPGSGAVAGAPAILMWNVGIQHRIGPYRIQVDIARELARRGFASLRFDLSGMGDSDARKDNRLDQERALSDVREAMSLLERRRGIGRFVVIGFCSSVDAAHALSVDDTRVVGACFLEGYAYRTRGFWLRYPLRLLDRQRWSRYLALRAPVNLATCDPRIDRNKLTDDRRSQVVFARQYPTQERFGEDVRTLTRRGVKLLFAYVGGDTDFNYRGQFAEMVGGHVTPRDGLEVDYYGGADHTFFRVADRERVVTRVGEWMARNFYSRDVGVLGESTNALRRQV